MLIAYWITAGLLALVNLAAGFMKLARPKDALQTSGMAYVEDLAGWQVKLIGALEVLGAIGVIVPAATSIAPILSPIAAIGIGLIQVGAIATHARRKENFLVNIGLLLLAAAVAVLGFLAL